MNERTRDPHLVDDAHALPHGVVGARRNHGDEEGEHVRHGVGLSRDAAKVVSKRKPGHSAISSPGSKELKAHITKERQTPVTANGMNSSL
jgi:hypothetical protein